MIIKQLRIKYTRSIAFARVVGGKHQTTAGELGTPTKAKMKIGEIEIAIKILNRSYDISDSYDSRYDYDMKKEFAEMFNILEKQEYIILEKSVNRSILFTNASLNQFDREIILTESNDFICPKLKQYRSYNYYGSKASGHYGGVCLSVKQIDSSPKGIIFKNALMTGEYSKSFYDTSMIVGGLNACSQEIIETIIALARFNKFANLEFTLCDIENIPNSGSAKLSIATVKCLRELLDNEIFLD